MPVSAQLRRDVAERAKHRCEYCGLAQVGQEAAFHVDHVIPMNAGGPTTFGNLALACVSCSLRKGARRLALDPQTGVLAPIFNPRRDLWTSHFQVEGAVFSGRTPSGRATISALKFNRTIGIAIREEEMQRDRYPPRWKKEP
jgi:hypothetical protein